MKFKKLAFGLSLTAAFGLMACGDDSSSSPNATGDLTPKCSVSSTDNSVGYTMTSGSVSTVFTAKVNKDGSITYTSTQTFPSSTFSSSELKMECEAAKKDASSENVELTCKSDEISATWTDDADEDVTLADLKKEYQFLCDALTDKKPSFDFEDDDDDEKQDEDSSNSKDDAENATPVDSSDDDGEEEDGDSNDDFDSPVELPGDAGLDSLFNELEKMPECTESNEGNKTTYMGMSMICKDGEWEPDMEDLGIDLGNCDSFKKSDDVWTKTMNMMGMEMTETYKWIDATTVEYTSSVKGLEAFAETETKKNQNRDDLYEYFCEE